MDPLRRTATLTPEALAVRGRPGEAPPTERSWLFAELDENADRIARVLGESGVGPGVGVAMRLPPCKEAVAALHGVLRSGAVLAPLNPDWTEAEVASGLDAVGVTVRVIDNREQVAEWLQAAKRDEALPVFEIGPPAPDPAPDDLAALVLTSGSTGVPRPVGITHANLAESAAKVIDRLDLRADDRWLTSLSLAHIGGLALIHRACVVGSSLITRSRFDATDVAELINSGEITHASLVPVMLKRLLDEFGDRPVPESLRCLLVGGCPAPSADSRPSLGVELPDRSDLWAYRNDIAGGNGRPRKGANQTGHRGAALGRDRGPDPSGGRKGSWRNTCSRPHHCLEPASGIDRRWILPALDISRR